MKDYFICDYCDSCGAGCVLRDTPLCGITAITKSELIYEIKEQIEGLQKILNNLKENT